MIGQDAKHDLIVSVGILPYDEKSYLWIYNPLDRPKLCIGGISNKVKCSLKKGSNKRNQESSPLSISTLDQGITTCRSKKEFPLANTSNEFPSHDTLLCGLVVMNGPFIKDGFLIENSRAIVSLPLWVIIHIRASILDTFELTLCGPQLVDAELSSYLWKSPRMLKASCYLHEVGQFEVSYGTLGSRLNILSRGKQSSWENYLSWIGLLCGSFSILPNGMTLLMEYFSSGSFWKKRGLMCLQCLFLSLCVPTCEYIFDKNSFISTFLHYLYTYDNVPNLVESTSYVGMNCLKGRIVVCLKDLTPS
ncbi:uncharacterized protein LOC107878288 isoform X1 [Capsicum annuum]|uniref:uncharacterized protein LOC107878288 isoform X1 n=1 Tax=Capsicum annuum TaxID=4072 RepID=UPI001FB0A9E4|nr:uncharacterized protein LOC107878288 isoform X1 [Capsicum annuum]